MTHHLDHIAAIVLVIASVLTIIGGLCLEARRG